MSRTQIQKGAWPHDTGCQFAVWAPHAVEVFIVGSFNGWDLDAHRLTPDDQGIWSGDVLGAKPGEEYRFRIVTSAEEHLRLDPYARKVTNSIGNAVIPHLPVPSESKRFMPVAHNEMVIYRTVG